MKNRIVLVVLASLLANCLFAQKASSRKEKIFNLPPSVPVPCWVTLTDWDHPNVLTIDSTIEACESRESHPVEPDGEENGEEPYRVAYTRWRRRVAPFIQANGTVVEDPGYYDRLLSTAINAQASKNA